MEAYAPQTSPKTEHFRLDYIERTYIGKKTVIDHLREQGGGLALHVAWISKMKRPYELRVMDTSKKK